MEHIPLPKNPTVGNRLRIPFLMTEEYDGGDFLSYLSRNKWEILPDPLNEGDIIWRRRGTIATPLEVAGMLQTWQFLGLIWAALGLLNFHGPIPRHYANFIKRTDYRGWDKSSKSYLNTQKLDIWFFYLMMDYVQSDRFRHKFGTQLSQLQRIKKYIVGLREYLMECGAIQQFNLLRSKKYHIQCNEAQLVAFSIGLLAEHISVYYCMIVHETTDSEKLRSDLEFRSLQLGESLEPEGGTAGPLVKIMREDGWCPSILNSFNRRRHMDSLTMLWFFANMQPPLSQKTHQECDNENCKYSITPAKDYIVLHRSSHCTCRMLGLDEKELRNIVDEGGLPLVEIEADARRQNASLTLRAARAESTTRFIAVSHIWQDGHGNQLDNTLPECFIKDLVGYCRQILKRRGQLKRTERFLIWMDTLCVPREPLHIRRKALKRLKYPFEKAEHVLALDSYLAALDSRSMFIIDMIGHVLISRWVQRLWTYQEGFLAKRLWFLFKDGVQELGPRATDLYQKNHWLTPTLLYARINFTILEMYGASNLMPIFNEDQHVRTLDMVHRNIFARRTSVKSDEALCLASIFGLDCTSIIEQKEGMYLFWSQLCQKQKVPSGIIFSMATTKLVRKGYRWAPSTLMKNTRGGIWVGFSGTPAASLGNEGLIVCFPSFKLQAVVKPESFDSPFKSDMWSIISSWADFWFYLKDSQGNWYRCITEQSWHQSMSSQPKQDDEISLLLNGDISPGCDPYGPHNLKALLITHRPSDKPNLLLGYGIVHRHIHMSIMPSSVNEYFGHILCAIENVFTRRRMGGGYRCHGDGSPKAPFCELELRIIMEHSYDSFIRDNKKGLEICISVNKKNLRRVDEGSLKAAYMEIALGLAAFWPYLTLTKNNIEKWCLD